MPKKKAEAEPEAGEKMVPVRVPVSIRRRLRMAAAAQDKPLQAVVTALLDEALKRHGA